MRQGISGTYAARADWQRGGRLAGSGGAAVPGFGARWTDRGQAVVTRHGFQQARTEGPAEWMIPGSFKNPSAPGTVAIHEMPGGTPTVREIAQTSMAFTGKLTAIDLGQKPVKAKALFDSKKFDVADNCAIVINGRTDGKLSDLKPNEKLVFNYDQIHGVNVVNRIGPAPVEVENNSKMMTTSPGYPGYPMGY